MNLNDIKGVIEIQGETYDPRTILQAILNQGLKIQMTNGSLLVGRTFIDPSSNLTPESSPCPIIDHCKIYDKVKYDSIIAGTPHLSSLDLESSFSSLDLFQSSPNESSRTYRDRIEVNDEDIDIRNLFADSTPHESTSDMDDDFDFQYGTDLNPKTSFESREMIGLSSPTRYGKPRIKPNKIPNNLKGGCPGCKTTININWKHCPFCGYMMN
ncbi:MAG: hypothetical protein HGN29_00640 [Asgard group archaeon]|nr:hypothetical protein [Asgard group archaeon]